MLVKRKHRLIHAISLSNYFSVRNRVKNYLQLYPSLKMAFASFFFIILFIEINWLWFTNASKHIFLNNFFDWSRARFSLAQVENFHLPISWKPSTRRKQTESCATINPLSLCCPHTREAFAPPLCTHKSVRWQRERETRKAELLSFEINGQQVDGGGQKKINGLITRAPDKYRSTRFQMARLPRWVSETTLANQICEHAFSTIPLSKNKRRHSEKKNHSPAAGLITITINAAGEIF